MRYLETLNPEQRAAAQYIQGPLLLLAGAGTGKTRVITYRILHMLKSGISPEKIVAVTFTNKAAKEMRERLKELCGDSAKGLFVGTFHSFCISILRKYAREAGISPRFQLVGSSDQVDLVSKALEERNLQGVYRAADWHAKISYCKNNLILVDDLHTKEMNGMDSGEQETLGHIYALYEKMLQLNQVIDFDDCILKCVELLKNNAEVRAKLHQQYEYYLVDEFQDTNFAQLSFLRNIVNDRDNICVVGDDDQSIYSWRGAMYETIERFESLFQKSHLIKLEQNYRCTKLILNAANSVIKNNVIRKDKTLWSEKFSDAPIILKPCRDETDEAQWIVLKILALLGRGSRPSDVGILYRANALARPIEIALREHRIQYKVFGGQSFFERKEIKDFMAYLRLVANPNDRMAFWRVINTPHRGMGIKSCEVIDEIAQNKSISPFMALKSALDVLPKKAVAAAQDFIEFIESAGKLEVQSPASFGDLCRYLIQGTKIDKYYKDKATTISVGLKKAEMIRDLPNWLEKSAESVQQEKGQLNFHELMDALTLQQEDRSKDESGADYVSLMSIHSAKGLEFPHVFLCGVEDDLLPHRNSVEEAQGISEERRLFYVAITRAKDQLFMTHTLSRSGITRQSESKKPSRFLDEIPQDIISCDGHFEKEVAERQINKREQTKSRLSSLKDELRLNK